MRGPKSLKTLRRPTASNREVLEKETRKLLYLRKSPFPASRIILTACVRPEHDLIRLQTIIRLRWLAVAGQTLTIAVVNLTLKFLLPLFACALLIGVLAASNIFMSVRFPATYRLGPKSTLLLLAFDLLQLAALLFITGGITNPFASLICVPVIISFTSQPLRYSIGLFLLAFVCATVLVFTSFRCAMATGRSAADTAG